MRRAGSPSELTAEPLRIAAEDCTCRWLADLGQQRTEKTGQSLLWNSEDHNQFYKLLPHNFCKVGIWLTMQIIFKRRLLWLRFPWT